MAIALCLWLCLLTCALVDVVYDAGQMELLMLPRMVDLLEKKWSAYASRLFLRRFVAFLSYLLIFAGT